MNSMRSLIYIFLILIISGCSKAIALHRLIIYLCEFAIFAKDANYPSLLNLQPPVQL